MAHEFNVSRQAVGFLVWFRCQYKVWTRDSYQKMAEKYGQCNYGTCRNLLLELERAGYINIWNKGSRFQRFYIDLEKYNELVNPYIFQKDDPRTQTPSEPKD